MNYYERHLGDYARDAGHLSMLEHGAYCLLLDRYYITEQGIPAEQAHRLCRAKTKEDRAAVDAVLAEFFTLDGGAWINGRAGREVIKAQTKIKAARENGKSGGRPKRTQQEPTGLAPGSDSVTQAKALQTPDTKLNHSEAIASAADKSAAGGAGAGDEAGERPKATDPAEIIFGYGVPLLTVAGSTDKHARSFLAGLRNGHGDTAVVDALRNCIRAKPLQPLEWLAKALPPKGTGKHAGFALKNYSHGVTEDGTLA